MFLKSLEVRGFKSFADKTELNFKKGITAVVGPNGSGKSNISDAVRWVLGEQSVKSLRGAKMEDVIFAGTQFRKPVSLAQVSLILNNEDKELDIDYSDVRITRRIYRSGESEYFINNTKCRLKDIQELFMDTGIGKEGYSLIGQGKIDAILGGRPEERRELLEEAAGIVKFKSRKQEAEKHLDNTEQNLIRINDIISTYEDRLGPLKTEMEKAKEFLSLSEELKEKEISLLLHSLFNIEKNIIVVKEEFEKVKSQLESHKNIKDNLKNELKRWNESLEEFDNKYNNEKQHYYENNSKAQNLSSDTQLLEEKINNILVSVEKDKKDIDDLENKLNSIDNLKSEQEKDLEYIKSQNIILGDKIKEEQINLESFFTYIEEINKKLLFTQNKDLNINNYIQESSNDIIFLERELLELRNRLEEYNLSCEDYKNSIKINGTTAFMLDKSREELKKRIGNYEDNIEEDKKQLSSNRSKLTHEENKLRELNNRLSRVDANYNVLVNLEKQHEGYAKAVKSLMDNISKGYVKDVEEECYILGDVIAANKQFEVAIEIALGASISNVITSNEEISKKLISYLKKNNLGRATFLPLTLIKSKKINLRENIKSIEGYIGVASELVRYDNKFLKAVEFSLGNVVIAHDMESALKIAKEGNYSFRIVTLGGDVINPGGSLTGGSIYNKSSNIMGRKRELKELSEERESLKVNLEKANICRNNVNKTISELDECILNLRDNIHSENIELTKVNEKINNIKEEASKITKELKNTDQKINDTNLSIKITMDKLEVLRQKLEKLKGEKLSNKDIIDELQITLSLNMNKNNKAKDDLTELKIKKAQSDETISNRAYRIERLREEYKEYNSKIQYLNNEIKMHEGKEKEFKLSIEKNKHEYNLIKDKMKTLEKLFEENEMERIRIKDNIKNSNEKFEEIDIIIYKLEKDYNKQALNLTKFETERDNYYGRLNEEFGITYAEALDYNIDINNVKEVKEKIENLKNIIMNLGLVNVGAIEEYKDVKDKYTFMYSQKEDLQKSKEEILSVIEEMTNKMKGVFKENFKILNEYFNDTFKELFKGGKASLILSEGDELSGKIDINVEPPGKKLQNINLMSGGEKVLSAIALLFAILKMKPTPFCILDEIEAALDDANVVRYAEFLNKFSNNIQFIVITHRKGTMGISDVLYGVTMEEKGVSKVVSVDLAEVNIK